MVLQGTSQVTLAVPDEVYGSLNEHEQDRLAEKLLNVCERFRRWLWSCRVTLISRHINDEDSEYATVGSFLDVEGWGSKEQLGGWFGAYTVSKNAQCSQHYSLLRSVNDSNKRLLVDWLPSADELVSQTVSFIALHAAAVSSAVSVECPHASPHQPRDGFPRRLAWPHFSSTLPKRESLR
jgi:hypothetical protein